VKQHETSKHSANYSFFLSICMDNLLLMAGKNIHKIPLSANVQYTSAQIRISEEKEEEKHINTSKQINKYCLEKRIINRKTKWQCALG